MHAELKMLLNETEPDYFVPDDVMLQNAERLLNYLDDINLERRGRFEFSPADSLYLLWHAERLEFHFECLQNGRILYTFRKNGYGMASGSNTIEEFIPLLQKYLLIGIC